jgi:uncharacterized membrane protein YagU involved in acid resistance
MVDGASHWPGFTPPRGLNLDRPLEVIHFALSVILALVLAWIVSRWHLNTGLAVAAGAVFGLVIYLVNFYPVASALFPWFAMARNWISILSHVVFGMAVAWVYVEMAARKGHAARPLS